MDTIRYLLSFLIKIVISLFALGILLWIFKAMFPQYHVTSLFQSSKKELTDDDSWLPAPGSFKGLLSGGEVFRPKEFVPAPAFSGYDKQIAGSDNNTTLYYVSYGPQGATVTYIKGKGDASSVGQVGDLPPDGEKIVTATNTTGDVGDPTIGDIDPTKKASNTTIQAVQTNTTSQTVIQYSPKNLYFRKLTMYEGVHLFTGYSFTGEARSMMFVDGKFPLIVVDQKGKVVTIIPVVATSKSGVSDWVPFQAKIATPLPQGVRCLVVLEQAKSKTQTQTPVRVAIPVLCN